MRIAAALLVFYVLFGVSSARSQSNGNAIESLPHIPQTYIKLAQSTGGRTQEVIHVPPLCKGVDCGKTWDNTWTEKAFFELAFQWPGIYFEAAFSGDEVVVWFNDKDNIWKVTIDGQQHLNLTRPGDVAGRIRGLGAGPHTIRIEKRTESQSQQSEFAGFFVPKPENSLPVPATHPRQIEFVGDSSTVGYGNTSLTRKCTKEEIWATTDTSQAFGVLTAKHYNADYQINAYSGRGVVRNYDGVAAGDPLPALYPYILFDHKTEYKDPNWQPQIIVIGLGGNDFSTPLHPGEKWADDAALKADYEASYVAFVKSLRAKNPKAFFILTSYDQPVAEAEVNRVADALKASGETHIERLLIKDFSRTGCDWHFDLNDHKKIFDTFTAYLDAHPELWQGK